MTPEIEKRIKAVQAGRVPAGYKRTKVGIVPKEWDELKLSHYLSVSKEKNTELKYSKEDVFSISGELGIVNQIELLGRSYAGVSVAPYGVVKPNDVVYTKSPLKANPYGIIKTNKMGKTGIVSTLYAIFNCKNNVNPNFVQYYFESDKNLNDYLHPIVNIGAKHDMKISDENSLSGIVVFPPLSEQKKIAEILATQDRVIELKEKLIAEKQSQKKYLMSVLLGDDFKKPFKLNGVTIDKKKWREVSLSDCCLSEGQYGLNAPACAFKDNLPKYIRITDIDEDGRYNRSSVAYVDVDDYENYLLNENDVLLVRTGSTTGKSYLYEKNDGKLVYAGFLIRFKINPEFVDKRVVYACLNTNSYWKWVGVMSMRSGQPGINATEYSKYRFKIPLDKKEQKAIADVLSAADEEISLLQKGLEQEKLKKKSLMQLLLTGLVRVNE